MTKQEKFIQKAIQKFGNKFDYSKVNYVRNDVPITIVCPIHGEFQKKPTQFLVSKHGCTKCANEASAKDRKKTTEQFIKESKAIWGNKFLYEKTQYVDNETKVIITCPIHGDFYTRPSDFLRKHGCPHCKGEQQKQLNKEMFGDTLDIFIQKSKQVHGDKYDYSKVIYNNSKTKVCIICPEHGPFWQTPGEHIKGCGCPMCNKSKGETQVQIILDELGIEFIPQYHVETENSNMYIDFCIKQNNQIYCIEYHGRQHFEPVEIFGGINGFINQVKRDYNLREYCFDNKIFLLELPYYLTKIQIKNKIKSFLNA